MVQRLQIWDQRIQLQRHDMAWSWYIPPEWHGVLTLNLLEFLASAVSIYMTIQQLVHISHVLVFTDSSGALGWMHKASFDPVNEGTGATRKGKDVGSVSQLLDSNVN